MHQTLWPACSAHHSSSGTSQGSTSRLEGAYAAKAPVMNDPCTAPPPLSRTTVSCRDCPKAPADAPCKHPSPTQTDQ